MLYAFDSSSDVKGADMDTRDQDSSHGLRLQMRLTKFSYVIGEELRPELSLKNTLTTSVTMTFPSSQRFDFFILDRDGREVYRWSRDRAFLTVIAEITLSPGEAIREELSWKIADVAPGDYTIRAETAQFLINNEKQKLISSPESVTISDTTVPEFMPGVIAVLSAGAILIAVSLLRSRRKKSARQLSLARPSPCLRRAAAA